MIKKAALKQIIDESGLRRAFIADRIGVKHATISQWVCGGAKPSREKLERLADLLNVPIEHFLTNDDHDASRDH